MSKKSPVKVDVNSVVLKKFPDLFSKKTVNGKSVDVLQAIGELTVSLDGLFKKALTERRSVLLSKEPFSSKYKFPAWDEKFEDPAEGKTLTYREIVEGLLDNFSGKRSKLAWRLNENYPIPDYAHPLKNPGLEITGPWHPLDMAIKQINADVASTMGPDDEDAAPADFVPYGFSDDAPGIFYSRYNESMILAGKVKEYAVKKKGEERKYVIEKPFEKWPTSFHRVPGIHLVTNNVFVNGKPAPAIVVDVVLHALNDFESLRKSGKVLLFYVPKTQSPTEAYLIGKLMWEVEKLLGASKPGQFIKFKALYEEGRLGLYLPVVAWMWRHWLIGLNVGRWDYTGSVIEMYKSERVLPDPQSANMGMASPHMMAYQRYNALVHLLAGMKDGEVSNGAPIGGMAAVMLYQEGDPYLRNRHNPVTLRAMWLDKMRERLIGLFFVTDDPKAENGKVTLKDALEGRYKGKVYDLYRQSWVASPDKRYVEAGNIPLRASLKDLQALISAPEEYETFNGEKVAPKVTSGLTQSEKKLFASLHLINENGEITPWVIRSDKISGPEYISSNELWGEGGLWGALYGVKQGDITIENVQHALYMAANYGFQALNGNLAAAIDDYVAFPGRYVRFMNDLATYRIFAAWLWTVVNHGATVTKDGWLMRPKLTPDGVIPGEKAVQVKAGDKVTQELFEKLWELHYEWTKEFYNDFDRLVSLRIALRGYLYGANVKVDRGTLDMLVQGINMVFINGYGALSAGQAAHLKPLFDKLNITQGVINRIIADAKAVQQYVSMAYGTGPSFARQLSYEEAAKRISGAIKVSAELAQDELEASAPRFDRSKAPLIMDILKRQTLSPLFVQHPARVIFSVADKSPEEAKKILDAVFYMDENGKPLFRDPSGMPSRDELVRAVKSGKVPAYCLEAHDYIYDIY